MLWTGTNSILGSQKNDRLRLRLRLRLRCISELVNTSLGQYPRRQGIRDAGQFLDFRLRDSHG